MNCRAEECEYWTGHGCVCEFMDLAPALVCKVCKEPRPEGDMDGQGVCYDCWEINNQDWLGI